MHATCVHSPEVRLEHLDYNRGSLGVSSLCHAAKLPGPRSTPTHVAASHIVPHSQFNAIEIKLIQRLVLYKPERLEQRRNPVGISREN
jgi:hypothetical protein